MTEPYLRSNEELAKDARKTFAEIVLTFGVIGLLGVGAMFWWPLILYSWHYWRG